MGAQRSGLHGLRSGAEAAEGPGDAVEKQGRSRTRSFLASRLLRHAPRLGRQAVRLSAGRAIGYRSLRD